MSSDVRLDGSSSIRPKGAGGLVLVPPCGKLVGQPLQEVVLVSKTANLDVRLAGYSSKATEGR